MNESILLIISLVLVVVAFVYQDYYGWRKLFKAVEDYNAKDQLPSPLEGLKDIEEAEQGDKLKQQIIEDSELIAQAKAAQIGEPKATLEPQKLWSSLTAGEKFSLAFPYRDPIDGERFRTSQDLHRHMLSKGRINSIKTAVLSGDQAEKIDVNDSDAEQIRKEALKDLSVQLPTSIDNSEFRK